MLLKTRHLANGLFVNLLQWAPTLGGECYGFENLLADYENEFQWAPTLGGECYEGTQSCLSGLKGS